MSCNFCDSTDLETFADLGTAPPSNSYITHLNYEEIYYPLHALVCKKCMLVQLDEYNESPNSIFTEYGYFSSESKAWLKQCEEYVDMIQKRFLVRDVCEIASNDGYLLQYFDPQWTNVIGVEPARNIAKIARERGIPTIDRFWSKDLVREKGWEKKFDLIIGNNVLAHTPYLNGFVEGVELGLADKGIATFEVPHLMNLIEENQWDTIYHEHFSYFSFIVLQRLFCKHGLYIFDVERLPSHGGSLRVYVCRLTDTQKLPTGRLNNVVKLAEEEGKKKYGLIDIYRRFNEKVKEEKFDIIKRLIVLKSWNKEIVCYGAPAKGNTLLNYCGIKNDLISYAVDSTPYKQGKYLPGSRIPVYHPDHLKETRPDLIWIMPWNHKEEILKKIEAECNWKYRIIVGPRMEFIEHECFV